MVLNNYFSFHEKQLRDDLIRDFENGGGFQEKGHSKNIFAYGEEDLEGPSIQDKINNLCIEWQECGNKCHRSGCCRRFIRESPDKQEGEGNCRYTNGFREEKIQGLCKA